MLTAAPLYKDLILIGGGHSHALVLKMWAMKPLPGVRLTLISPQVLTPYSGMLPGLIAGHYGLEETHIDLPRLCRYANARFIQAAVTGIDPSTKEVLFADRTPLGFDLLSINSGISPDLRIPGAAEFATAVKPIAAFYPRWQALKHYLRSEDTGLDTGAAYRIAIVGGGAAGVELILAMHYALSRDSEIKRPLQFCLIQQGEGLPENYPPRLQRKVAALCDTHQIEVIANTRIARVSANTLQGENNKNIPFNCLFWCTNASASPWLKATGLDLDKQGFISVNQYLQSTSHNFVFAAGDIAQQENFSRPRAGVFAVRQGPVLFNNLRKALLAQPLQRFRPQKTFLSLLACGDQYAMACKPGAMPSFSGKWVWRLKDRIDRRFMAMFSGLSMADDGAATAPVAAAISGESPADISAATGTSAAMRCGGCGAKVGASLLNRVMQRITPINHDGVVLGLNSPDDASAIEIPAGQLLLQSVDVFRALLDDHYVLGQISAQHALSDLFAMNARPHSALAIATLPYGAEAIVERDLLQIMSGAVAVLNENNCALIGGHTSEGAELSLGFSVNGTCKKDQLLQKTLPLIGHQLILTQPLGTGTLFAAHAQLAAKGQWISGAIAAMQLSNRRAGEIFYRHQASACTDITGFGLLGHLLEMLKPSGHGASISLGHLPSLDGALDCFSQGISSSLQPQNSHSRHAINDLEAWSGHPVYPLLFDPQTSGGLLASVADHEVDGCLQALHTEGYQQACVIGQIVARADMSAEKASVLLRE
ncbi:MAG: selenide, water dikinase SelD [Gammaproteobacteria bacterium]|nr:selenide, water dikinase SelD [Gammaproteobacteria bacterium]MBQ0840644.1 selenide, water dikinase SelD [Gammaproteobacteria bacterium]